MGKNAENKYIKKYICLDDLNEYPIRLAHYDKKNGNKHFVYGIKSVLEYANNLPFISIENVVITSDEKKKNTLNDIKSGKGLQPIQYII